MELKPTSFRFTEQALEVMDAWAAHLSAKKGRKVGRVDVVEALIARVPPPEDLTEEAAELRRVHRAFKEARQA
jgi:hypothetical protein